MNPNQIQLMVLLVFFFGMIGGWLLRCLGSMSFEQHEKILDCCTEMYAKLLQSYADNFNRLDKSYDDLTKPEVISANEASMQIRCKCCGAVKFKQLKKETK